MTNNTGMPSFKCDTKYKFNFLKDRQMAIDVGLRMRNIELHPDILKKVIEVVDLINRKKEAANIKDIIDLEKK